MDKPVQLVIADLKSGLSNVLNNAQLPMVCITPVVKELYENCMLIEREQYMQAKEGYEKSLEAENNKNSQESKDIQKPK